MFSIHGINEFMSRDFFAAVEICAFTYFVYCVGCFIFLPKPAPVGICAKTLAPIFEEPDPIQRSKPVPTRSTPKTAPTLSSLIREQVAAVGIQKVRDRNLLGEVDRAIQIPI